MRRAHDFAEGLTEGVIYLMVIFSPWAFGSTEEWSMGVMNVAGCTLGVLLGLKWLARMSAQGCHARAHPSGQNSRILTRVFAGATLLIPAYCLLSAVNARCVYLGDFEYKYFSCLNWLPHSYDARSTWQAFWNYLALAFDFWAIRDWLLGLDGRERARKAALGSEDAKGALFIPRRLKRLLWVLSVNGAIIAAQGLFQRALGGGKLLWLVEPQIHKVPEEQFGPYAYRSNAAQYFLLLWPVVLGFWRLLGRRRSEPGRWKLHNHLVPCILIMAMVPFMSLSRAGAFIDAALVIGAIAVLRQNNPAGIPGILAATSLLGMAILLGGYLEWEHLAKRFEVSPLDVSRLEIWRNTWEAFKQNSVFGTGPGTFSSVYGFYWSSGMDQGIAQAHNDYLELLMTFGVVGSAVLLGTFALFLASRSAGQDTYLGRAFPSFIRLGLGSCLLYAAVDFPFTIYSILFLFILECALLSSVSSHDSNGRVLRT